MDGMPSRVVLTLPRWVAGVVRRHPPCRTDEERMRLAIALARENVVRGTGGPFGAAVFERDGERPVAVGVNQVEPLGNPAAHAEVLALVLATARLGSYTLHLPELPTHDLFTSCDPCAMCLGAALWGGVGRIVCGAGRADALALGFEEGPVFPESHRYLAARGIAVVEGMLADEARVVLQLYRDHQGPLYNG
jgi:tRNA(Arg) A34 adenosine deaminase TadA